jgi:hypothetical protein
MAMLFSLLLISGALLTLLTVNWLVIAENVIVVIIITDIENIHVDMRMVTPYENLVVLRVE